MGEYGDFNVASAVILEVHGEIAPKVVPAPDGEPDKKSRPRRRNSGFLYALGSCS